MFETITDPSDRGQVGIGTLIVFIAMVLVAAIAAGVLINTAGFLQTQAESTGEASSEQVSNNINVIGAVGEVVSATPNTVETVRLTVQKSAGAGDIDLAGLSIEYVGPDSFGNLVHIDESDDAANEPVYGVEAITAETETDTVMTAESDRYQIVIPLDSQTDSALGNPDSTTIDNTGSLSTLEASEQVEITITTEAGSQRYVNLRVPDSLVGDGGGTVQL